MSVLHWFLKYWFQYRLKWNEKKEIKTHHKTALEMLQYACGHIFIDRGIEQQHIIAHSL